MTEELDAGIRASQELDGFEIEEEPRWRWRERVWAFPCRLKVEVPPATSFPAETRWWVLLAPTYPQGAVELYPDAGPSGLRGTYPHQRYNAAAIDGRPWRGGELCLRVDIEALSPVQGRYQPKAPEKRLRWNLERALVWLELAAQRQLLREGDRFELPDVRFGGGKRLAFAETAATLAAWDSVPAWWGWVATKEVGGARVVWRFDDSDGSPLVTPSWGVTVREAEDGPAGAWIRLPGVPVVEPWQAPATWRELKASAGDLGSELEKVVNDQIRGRFRGSKHRHPLLFGFPIPERTGCPPSRMHWIGFDLPRFAAASEVIAGFRAGSRRGGEVIDRRRLHGLKPLPWFDSQGWSDEELTGRGKLCQRLRHARILLLGAGALGSEVGELLVRGGVRDLTIVDPEDVEAGNLVRHRLTLVETGVPKAVALARRLNRISPHAEVLGARAAFPYFDASPKEVRQRLDRAELIVDTTANDDVQVELERYGWGRERSFVSVSFGPECRRLYLFVVRAERFPASEFVGAASGWLEADWSELEGMDLPREGAGCWDPLIPGRGHEVGMLAAAAVEAIDEVVAGGGPVAEPRFVVLEQIRAGGRFAGVRRSAGELPVESTR